MSLQIIKHKAKGLLTELLLALLILLPTAEGSDQGIMIFNGAIATGKSGADPPGSGGVKTRSRF